MRENLIVIRRVVCVEHHMRKLLRIRFRTEAATRGRVSTKKRRALDAYIRFPGWAACPW
jgi:hypothetical protein